MNTFVKIIVAISALVLLMNIMGAFVPDTIFSSINDAIVYFLSYINYLSPVVHVSVVFSILKFLGAYILGLTYVMIAYFVVNFIA